METVIETLKVTELANGHVEVTLRGEVGAVVDALATGLSYDALRQLREAIGDELAKRRGEAHAVPKEPY